MTPTALEDVDDPKAALDEVRQDHESRQERVEEIRERVAELEERRGKLALDDDPELEEVERQLRDLRRERERLEASEDAAERRIEALEEAVENERIEQLRARYRGLRSAQARDVREASEAGERFASLLVQILERHQTLSTLANRLPGESGTRARKLTRRIASFLFDRLGEALPRTSVDHVPSAHRGRRLADLLGFPEDGNDGD